MAQQYAATPGYAAADAASYAQQQQAYTQQQQQTQQAPPQPPTAPELKTRIDKFITYLVRVGPDFEQMLREKQRDNPDFAFLQGGVDHQYYQWRLWCMRNGWTEEQLQSFLDTYYPPGGASAGVAGAAAAASGAAQMTPELESEFTTIMSTIDGSKPSIKNGRKWVVKHAAGNPARVAELLTARMLSLRTSPFEAKLHLVYLLNDILYDLLKKRSAPAAVDAFAAAVGPHLLAIFDTACRGHSKEEQDKVIKVVRLWGTREIYPEAVVADLEAKMTAGAAVPHYPVAAAAAAAAAAAPAAFAHAAPQPGYAQPAPAFNPHVQGFAQHGFAPQAAAAPMRPSMPANSTLHLGPGFIVTLTKGLPPYTPMDPQMVPAVIPPQAIQPPDAYMLTRLDHFYEELNREARRPKRRSRSRSPRRRSRSPRRRSPPKADAGGAPKGQFAAVPPPAFN